MPKPARVVAAVQGFYYVVTGLWPWVSLATFEAVTGPKTDDWLVQTVGALVLVVGLVLLYAAAKGRVVREVRLLAVGAAAAFLAVEVGFALRDVVSGVYLLDAAVQAAFALGWIVVWRR